MRPIRRFLCNNIARMGLQNTTNTCDQSDVFFVTIFHGWVYKTQQTREMHWWSSDVPVRQRRRRCVKMPLTHGAHVGMQPRMHCQRCSSLSCTSLIIMETYAPKRILCLANDDIAKSYKRWNACFRGSLQGCEYMIWATNHWKVPRKSAFHLVFHLPSSWFGDHRFWKSEQTIGVLFEEVVTGSSPKSCTHTLVKNLENAVWNVCSVFQNLRLGSMKLDLSFLRDFSIQWFLAAPNAMKCP